MSDASDSSDEEYDTLIADSLRDIGRKMYEYLCTEEDELPEEEEDVAVVRANNVPPTTNIKSGQTWEARSYRFYFCGNLTKDLNKDFIFADLDDENNKVIFKYKDHIKDVSFVIGYLQGTPAEPGFLYNGLAEWGARGYKYLIRVGSNLEIPEEREYSVGRVISGDANASLPEKTINKLDEYRTQQLFEKYKQEMLAKWALQGYSTVDQLQMWEDLIQKRGIKQPTFDEWREKREFNEALQQKNTFEEWELDEAPQQKKAKTQAGFVDLCAL